MEQYVKLNVEELENIKKISTIYEELTRTSSLLLIEKIKVKDRLDYLETEENKIIVELKKNIINEQNVTDELRKKYGEFKNINIENGEIILK